MHSSFSRAKKLEEN